MQELSHFDCQRYKNFLRGQILVLFATRLVAQCWAQIPIQDNFQPIYRNLEQLRCQQGYALTTIDEFFLLDLLGSPEDELQGLESTLLETLITTMASATPCPLANIKFNASLITSSINQTSNKDSHHQGMDHHISSSHQVFSDILRLQTLLCQPSACDTPASIFRQNKTQDTSSQQAGSQWLQGTSSCPFSTCTFPTLSTFLRAWRKQSIFESFEIQSLTPLFLQGNCSDVSFAKFTSRLHITLATSNRSNSPPEWTNNMLDVFAELFTDSYNRVNALSSTLCDPNRRRLTKSRASVVDLSNITLKLEISISGICQDCQSIFNIFEVLDEEDMIEQDQGRRQRRLEPSNCQSCCCPNSSETLMRGPTVDEFVAVLRKLVEQETGTESELSMAEVMEIQEQVEVQAAQTRMISPRCGDAQVTSFETNITIDYSGVCQALADSDIEILEDAILNTYNDMVQTQYCDPVSRRITNVTFVTEVSGVNDGQLAVQFVVAGTCQGCNSTTSSVSIFGNEEVDSTTGDSQSVQTNVPVNADDGTSCSCPTDVVASRAPTEVEFLGAYETTVLALSQELICVTTLFGAVIPTERPSMAPTVLSFDCPVNLSTPLTSQLLVTLNENATQTTLEELGQDLINTYNAFISETYSPCQTSKYREITSFKILTENSTIIDGRGRVRGRQLTGIPINADDIVFQLNGGCAGCNATEIFFDPNVLSRDDLVEYYSQVVDTGLDYLSEIVTMECPSTNTSTFEITVIVEYVPDGLDRDTLSLDVVLQQALADLYMATYNDLSREYCDPYSRQLQSATIVLVGDNNTQGNIPVEMELVGTCSDCDGLALSVYDEPESQPALVGNTSNAVVINATGSFMRRDLQSMSRIGRSLQGSVSESCYCPAHPIGDRAPYETEFLDAYREAVNATSQPTVGQVARQLQVDILDNLDLGLFLSVAECQFGTRFETGIVVRFQARVEDLTDEMIQSIEEALLQSIAALYQSSEVVCDPQFRIVKNVQASVVRGASSRRDLQSLRERKVQQVVSEAPSISPAPSASSAPSSSFRPTFSLAGSPTQAPTMPTLDSGVVDFFLYVSGVCNGCENGITFSDQTIDGRRLQQVNDWWERQLQSEATSSCFCPIGSVILEPPTLDELLSLFSRNLRSLNITFPILDFGEVPVVDCTVPVTQFTTQFQYTISLEPDITSVQLQAVGDIVKSTYNSLVQDYCDPLDQTIDSVQLVQFSPASNAVVGQNPCADHDVTFQVIGSCRGCDGDSLLTSTSTSTTTLGGRRLAMNQDPYGRFATEDASSTTAKRWLQIATDSATECFCDGNVVANRAPNTEEYNNALATALNQFEVTNVCGLPDLFPSSLPSLVPTLAPTLVPTLSPTLVPRLALTLPTVEPIVAPTLSPSFSPVAIPTPVPTVPPTLSPVTPVQVPAVIPTERPSDSPSAKPSAEPSARPSRVPSARPSSKPSAITSKIPSARPSTSALAQPVSAWPSSKPSARPSSRPSRKPSARPSSKPSTRPSSRPSAPPSTIPFATPSSELPSARPSTIPSAKPSSKPSSKPSARPSTIPFATPSSQLPSARPSTIPSAKPSSMPSRKPSARPSTIPFATASSQLLSARPSTIPSAKPSSKPSSIPSARPSAIPSAKPSRSARPSSIPSARPSTNPSAKPSQSVRPSSIPSAWPSSNPSAKPSQSARPSSLPSARPSTKPSSKPSTVPSNRPSDRPSVVPSSSPSARPSTRPSALPSARPSQSPRPSSKPSAIPSARPSDKPSARPSNVPSAKPSAGPSSGPSQSPTQFPSYIPSGIPFNCETDCPFVEPPSACVYGECIPVEPLRFTLTWGPDDDIRLRVTLPSEGATFDWNNPPNPMTGTYTRGTFVESIELFAPATVGTYQVCVQFQNVTGMGTDGYTLTITEGGEQNYEYISPSGEPPDFCYDSYFYPFTSG